MSPPNVDVLLFLISEALKADFFGGRGEARVPDIAFGCVPMSILSTPMACHVFLHQQYDGAIIEVFKLDCVAKPRGR